MHEPTEGLKDNLLDASVAGAEKVKKVKNTSLWIDESGVITQRYQKVHLFDVEIEGGPVLKESNSVEKGMSILPPFATALGRVGLLICFDVSHVCHSTTFIFLLPNFPNFPFTIHLYTNNN